MKTISKSATVDDIMSWYPCWVNEFGEAETRAMIVELFAGRESLTALDIMRLNGVSDADKHWAVLRPAMIDERTLHLIACDIAEQIALPVWYKYHPNDNRPAEAIRIKRLWVDGKATDDELRSARRAARSAVPAAYAATDADAHIAAYTSSTYAAAVGAASTTDADAYTAACGKISEIIISHLEGEI